MEFFALATKVRSWASARRPWVGPAALAAAGTLLFYYGVKRYKDHLGYDMKAVRILVTANALQEGQVIAGKDLDSAAVAEKYLPIGVLSVNDAPKIVGRTVVRPLAKGEMLLWSAIDVSYAPAGPAARIPKGYRALAVNVDATSSIGQAVRPGDYIDLVTTFANSAHAQGAATFTLLQNVAVLDVGQATQPIHDSYDTVTLIVLPKEVTLITFAQQHGRLSLVLRHPEDHATPRDLPMISADQLIETGFRHSLQQERNDSIEIIRGGKFGL